MVCKNQYLNKSEMKKNAQEVANFFIKEGWTKNAISGMLGNMQRESTLNPCLWESLKSYDHDPYITVKAHGYGLVQWTPFNLLTKWARDNNKDYKKIKTQCERLMFEKNTKIEWYTSNDGFPHALPETWEQFSKSTKSPEYLAEVFMENYERPHRSYLFLKERQEHARYWFNNINWEGSTDPNPDPEPDPDPEIDFGSITKFFKKFTNDILSNIEKMLIVNLYDYGSSHTKSNNFLKIEKTFNNIYKIKPTLKFNSSVEKLFNNGLDDLLKILGNLNFPNPNPDPEPEPDPNIKKYFPVKIQNGINFFTPPQTQSPMKDMLFGADRGGRKHAGYDIGGGGYANHKVYAVTSGEVIATKKSGEEIGRGELVRIKHDSDEYYTMYMHLKPNSTVVKVGDKVKAGQQIGIMGQSGGNYAIHLHIELDKTGKFLGYNSQFDPLPYLKITGQNKTDLPQP